MKVMVKELIDSLVKFNDTDLAELEKGIKEVRLARREVEKNEAIQNFKKAYLELCNWVSIYYNIDYRDIDRGVALLEDFDNFDFE